MAMMRINDVEPNYYETDLEGQSPVSYTLSMNLHRRHLDDSQKAMVAARAKSVFEAAAKERQGHGKTAPGKTLKENLPEASSSKSQRAILAAQGQARDKAGESVGVSGKSVDFASKVLTNGSKALQDAVDSGNVAVSVAAKLTELPKSKQTELVQKASDEPSPRKVLTDASKKVQQIASADDDWTESETDRYNNIQDGRTVVANSKDDARLIAWADEQGVCVYVGRGSEWGNPFILDKDGTRDEVCDKYDWYLDRKPSLDPANLKGCVLVCYCYPNRCHGDELARRADK